MTVRSAFYVDGFNVYHAIDNLQQPHLKWLNWHALATLLIPSVSEALVGVTICTAIKTTDTPKMLRHRAYLAALRSTGVRCVEGHFADEFRNCRDCGSEWQAPVEKQGDVNLAISAIDDAHRDIFDHCYLVSADGDQVATAKMLKERFPKKRLTTVVITGKQHSKQMIAIADAKMTVSDGQLERCLFPRVIPGAKAILRPTAYDPPSGWVPPDQRPK